MKNFMKIGGGLLGLGGSVALLCGASTPVGWGIIIGGAVIGILSSLLESKASKMKKAISKISESLDEQIEKQQMKTISSVDESCKANFKLTHSEVKTYFELLIEGIDHLIADLEASVKDFKETIDELNHSYACRVIDWLEKNSQDTIHDPSVVKSVTRTLGHELKIETTRKIKNKRNAKDILSILQEKLIINKKTVVGA